MPRFGDGFNGRYILVNGVPEPCEDLLTWGRWMESGVRTIERTQIGDVTVSTVFLGLDHRFGPSGPPILWETMIFGGSHDGYCERHTSGEDARLGHAIAVAVVQMEIHQ
jgi:hypothetical protein